MKVADLTTDISEAELKHAVRISLYALQQLDVSKADLGAEAVAMLRYIQEKLKARAAS